jgi:regulator of replication initiation timing
MTDEQLKELRRLADAATPGPWEVECGVSTRSAWSIRNPTRAVLHLNSGANIDLDSDLGGVEENLELVAAARTAVPPLLDEVEKLRALVNDPTPNDRILDLTREVERLRRADWGKWKDNEADEALARAERAEAKLQTAREALTRLHGDGYHCSLGTCAACIALAAIGKAGE